MARFNKIRTIRLFMQMAKKAESIIKNPDEFRLMIKDARDALEGKGDGPLTEIAGRLKMLLAMLNDYRLGRYRKIPVRTIVSIAGVMLYLTSPLDAVPDFIPVIGMIDDIFVINFIWKQLSQDLERYHAWKTEQADDPVVEIPDGTKKEYISADFETIEP